MSCTRSFPVLSLLLLSLGTATVGVGCRSAAPAGPGGAATPATPGDAAPANTPDEPESAPLETKSLLDPPDGVWRTDDQQRDYWLLEVPKIEGHYLWIDEEKTKVKLHGGGLVDVESHDDRVFKVKIYRMQATQRPDAPTGPTAQEIAALEASYRANLPQTDRLTFTAFDAGLPTRGQWRNGFAVRDVDGDGHPDILHGPPRKGDGRALVFRSNGKGQWGRVPLSLEGDLDYGDIAAGDVDGDGVLDLTLGCHLRGITAFRGLGEGKFAPMGSGLTLGEAGSGPAFSSRAIELADWNGDGILDLIAMGEGPQLATSRDVPNPNQFVAGSRGLRIFLGSREGTWSELAVPGARVYSSALRVLDLDGDGNLDAVFATDSGGNAELILRGRGAAAPELLGLQGLRPGAVVRSLAAGDLNGDGHPDLVLAYTTNELGTWRSGLDLLVQGPNLSFSRQPLWSQTGRAAEIFAVEVGDVDGDGKLDVFGLIESGHSLLLLGNGDGRFVQEAAPELFVDGGCRGYDLEIVDLDGDGLSEVIAAFAGDSGNPNPMAMMSGFAATCSSGGSLRAWKASRRLPG